MRRLFEVAQANGQMSQGSFYPAEADTFSVVVVEAFDGVAIENRNDLAGEVSNGSGGTEHEQERAESEDMCSSPRHTSGGETTRRPSDETEPSAHQ